MANVGSSDDKGVLNYLGQVSAISGAGGTSGAGGGSGKGSWLKALASAWGERLNAQAAKITDLSTVVGNGATNPSDITNLSTVSLEFGFLSQSASTSIKTGFEGAETLAKRQ